MRVVRVARGAAGPDALPMVPGQGVGGQGERSVQGQDTRAARSGPVRALRRAGAAGEGVLPELRGEVGGVQEGEPRQGAAE